MGARGKTLFLILASIVLTACGGGGGGDDVPSAPMDSHLDTTFGAGGKVTTPIGTGNDDEANALVLQPDGKLVAAGFSLNGTTSDFEFALVRYNVNGTLDTTFNSTGKVTTPIGGTVDDIHALVLQVDNSIVKIVAAGSAFNGTNFDFALARYNADGTLDTTFNSTGKVITPIGSSDDQANAIVLQPDGKLVVAGSSNNGIDFDFALVRYNVNGTLDTTFNVTGMVTTPIGAGNDGAFSLVLQNDGKPVAAGASHTGSNSVFALARYNSDGSLDSTFNGTGKVTTSIGGTFDEVQALVLQPDGKLVAAGSTDNGANFDFALVRYNVDGTLDTGFGTAGKITTAIGGSEDNANALVLQSDGKLVAAGDSFNGTSFDFALTRYLP